MGRFIDETGNKYGLLTVLYLDKESLKPSKRWICQCECGMIKSVSGTVLRQEKAKSCGCLQKKTQLNMKFGEWTVINEKGEKTGQVLCQCSCGTIKSVYKNHLTTGASSSCGNVIKHHFTTGDNLIGQRFNKLVVIERDWDNNENGPRWICQCDCGKQKSILGKHLKNQKIQSCGCINYSIGEQNIANILKNNNIEFIQEFRPENLQRKLRFDFYIPNNNKKPYFIEFDGKQHTTPLTTWSNTIENFKDLQKRDEIKNNYCLENNIPLIRIPYEKRDCIILSDLIPNTSNYLFKGDD